MKTKNVINKSNQLEKVRNELNELNDVYNNWTYYDVESLLYTIREKQIALRNLEAVNRRHSFKES